MSYFFILAPRTVVEAFESVSASELSLEEIENAPEGDGLFFDLDSISSILIWIKENKDVLVASANIVKTAIDYLKSGKTNDKPVTIIIRLPDDKQDKIEIVESTTQEEVAEKIRKLTENRTGA